MENKLYLHPKNNNNLIKIGKMSRVKKNNRKGHG